VNEEDEPALALRCREGDRHAFEQLVLRYQKPVFNVALRMLHDRQDAMDVAQTTFLKVFEHLGDYDPAFRLYSWIYRIAINETLDVLGARKPLAGFGGEEPDGTPGPDRQAEGEQTLRTIEGALLQIKPELRTVVTLRHFMHLSYEEMADVLQLPEKTVKSRLYTARQLLREHLQRAGADLT
jgi:RNA polymerase sigma-70 factor, ECF subfamily